MSGFLLKKDILYSLLKEKIWSGEYKSGEHFPNERDFAKQLGVAKVTLRAALSRLADEGLVIRKQAKGTIISANAHKKHIIIVIPENMEIESPNHTILPGIEKRAAELNIEVEKCYSTFFSTMSIESMKDFISSGEFSGIIYLANSISGQEQNFLSIKATGLPVVMPHANYKDHTVTGFATIYPDEKKAIQDGLKHLATHGHVSIATIFNKTSVENYSRHFFLEEYMDTLGKTGLTAQKQLAAYCFYDRNEISKAVHEFLSLGSPPTAIFCTSDFYALHVYEILKGLKIEIPRQIAVMGYANYPGGRFFNPSLSTIDLNMEKAGRTAIELLDHSDQWWGKGKSPPFLTIDHEIIQRESTRTIRIEKKLRLGGVL